MPPLRLDEDQEKILAKVNPFGFTTQSGVVLRIECPFTYRTSRGETILLDPENDPAQLGPVLSVVRSTVLNACADEAGPYIWSSLREAQSTYRRTTNMKPGRSPGTTA